MLRLLLPTTDYKQRHEQQIGAVLVLLVLFQWHVVRPKARAIPALPQSAQQQSTVSCRSFPHRPPPQRRGRTTFIVGARAVVC